MTDHGEPEWKTRLRTAVEKSGRSMRSLSIDAGLGETFVRDVLVRDRIPGIDKLIVLARFLRLPPSHFLSDDTDVPEEEVSLSSTTLRPAYRAGTVEAGAWREVDMLDQSDVEWLALPPDPQFPQATQEVYDVSGDSMNALKPFPILPGSQVVALRYEDLHGRVPLRDKMVVVVERTRDGGHTRELSIKQVEFFEDRIEFHPRSTNQQHKPIVVQHDSWADNGTTVSVRALVRRTMNELPL